VATSPDHTKTYYFSGLYIGPNSLALKESTLLLEAPSSEFISDSVHPVTDSYRQFGARDYSALAGRKDVLVLTRFRST
jgi:hypothetical protein